MSEGARPYVGSVDPSVFPPCCFNVGRDDISARRCGRKRVPDAPRIGDGRKSHWLAGIGHPGSAQVGCRLCTSRDNGLVGRRLVVPIWMIVPASSVVVNRHSESWDRSAT